MIDPPAPPPARIFTMWGTVLYVDEASGELRHGPIDSSPANAVFRADSQTLPERRRGPLLHDRGEASAAIRCTGERSLALDHLPEGDAGAAGTLLDLIPLERGLLAFTAEGRFLCAEPDGRVTLERPWCSTWEWFLASEDWCGAPLPDGSLRPDTINWQGVAKYIIDARLRIKANSASKATKILIHGYPAWSHGRVYYDLCRRLYEKGYIVDIIDWQGNHAGDIRQLEAYYDLIVSALDGVRILVELYGVACEKVIGLSHHEMDIRILLEQMGKGIFERLAGYGVVSYQLFDASIVFGVPREPLVVPLGVDFEAFRADIPQRLATVGYAGSYSQKTPDGLEWKRGEIAEAAAREAGLEFKVAGSTSNQISFHDMPEFYKSVDAILVSSVTEGAQLPIREGAAAGRLVISTPVGDFPLRAGQGIGILAPIESRKYKSFVADTLRYYKDNPADFAEICRKTQEAAHHLDWRYMIDDWVELIETAREHHTEVRHVNVQKDDAARFPRVALPVLGGVKPRLTICCSLQRGYDQISVLFHSLMCQTYRPFKLMMVHDGPNDEMSKALRNLRRQFPSLYYEFLDTRLDRHGYSLQDKILIDCKTEFIMFASDDSYYLPVFLEFMFKKIDESSLDLVLCDMIDSDENSDGRAQGSYNASITQPHKFSSDVGCFIIKTELARAVGFDDKSSTADASFIDAVITYSVKNTLKWGKVDKVLFVHT